MNRRSIGQGDQLPRRLDDDCAAGAIVDRGPRESVACQRNRLRRVDDRRADVDPGRESVARRSRTRRRP